MKVLKYLDDYFGDDLKKTIPRQTGNPFNSNYKQKWWINLNAVLR